MAPEPPAVLEVRDLRRSYGRFRRVEAVRGVSFTVRRGEIFGLIGPDGAGKTSIIQTLAAVLRPQGGTATVERLDVVADAERVKARIGYMPQGLGSNLYDSLTVAENIEFFRDLRRLPADVYAANRAALLAATRLEPFLTRRAETLSGGMRQKLALICTLIHLPAVLLLDEPTTGVDPISRQEFWQIIRRVVEEQQTTVLVSTSYMDEAERCHRVALLHQGRVVAEGAPGALASRGHLEERFLQLMGGEERPREVHFDRVQTSTAEAAIDCRAVTRRFGRFTAVAAVDLSVGHGEILGLLGPNGAGKTTLIKMMCGLLEPSSGTVIVGGIDVRGGRDRVWRAIGYMSQRFSLYQDLTVRQNLRLYADLYGVDRGRYETLLERLGLEPVAARLTRDLPGGVRQRVSLICAILHNPPIVFLDEPTSGVDPRARRVFWTLIHDLSREAGVSVVVSTHYMSEATNCDRLGLMHDGRLVALGTPQELTQQAEARSGRPLSMDETFIDFIRAAEAPHV